MKLEICETIEAKYFTLPFADLVRKYPELNIHLISTDPVKFNLGDPVVLSILNQHLYKEVVGLEIRVPKGYLIPSLGIRYAYCDYINSLIKSKKPIIEIGVGASAALSMILSKTYNHQVIATEIDPISIEAANQNISINNLQDSINLLASTGKIIDDIIPPGDYSALISYPPIYSGDLTKLKKKRGWKGSKSELIGGKSEGLEFANKLLEEALNTTEVKIKFVSLLLMNLKQIKSLLSIIPIDYSYKIIEILAGTRKRYILIISEK